MTRSNVYRLEALAELAAVFPAALTAAEIAARRHIPQKFLGRLLAELVRERVLVSQRGAGGGIRLARSPEQVRLADVLGIGNATPPRETAARFLWERLRAAHTGALANLTLTKLVEVEHTARGRADYQI